MKLSVGDRLILLSILPQESNIITLKVIQKLKDDLGFSEDEIKELNLRQEDEKVVWDSGIDDKDVEFGEKATDIIVDAFKKLNSQNKLREEHIPLYEQFINTP